MTPPPTSPTLSADSSEGMRGDLRDDLAGRCRLSRSCMCSLTLIIPLTFQVICAELQTVRALSQGCTDTLHPATVSLMQNDAASAVSPLGCEFDP